MRVMKEQSDSTTTRNILTKKHICKLLHLPFDGIDEEYTSIKYAEKAVPGCLAFINKSNASPASVTTPEAAEKLADIAISKGAKRLLYSKQLKNYPCLVVHGHPRESIIEILSELCAQTHPLAVEITGSYGKTTISMMIESVLSYKFNTFGMNGINKNTFQWTLDRIQKLKPEHEVYIQEAAEGATFGVPGMISRMIHPSICVVSSVGTSHLERLKTREGIRDSCLSLQEGMSRDGTLVLNADDPYLNSCKVKRHAVYYGIKNASADYRAVNIHESVEGLHFEILHDGIYTPVKLQCIGEHNAQNAAAVFAVGKLAGMSDKDIVAGLSLYRPEGIRQSLIQYGGYRFYVDCYNASVESMKSAIDTISKLPIEEGSRRIAVLADIREAGDMTEEVHRTVGRYIRESAFDMLVCYGDYTSIVAEEASKGGKVKPYLASSHEDIVSYLRANAKPSDIIMLKGSHALELEKVVDLFVGTWLDESTTLLGRRPTPVSSGKTQFQVVRNRAIFDGSSSKNGVIAIPSEVEKVPVTGIGAASLKNAAYKNVVIPNSVFNIRNGAFSQCKNLQQMAIPGNVKLIDDEAFSDCISLKEVFLGKGCMHIGRHAFSGCTSLERITIPETVGFIADDAFSGCERLTVLCPRGSYAEDYCKRNGIKLI